MDSTEKKYLFHQTPEDIARKLIGEIDFAKGDTVCEPFRGEGSFYNNFPEYVKKSYGEIREGIDYRSIDYDGIDWIATNPPFQLENAKKKRVNAFWAIIDYFTQQNIRKGICLLANDFCFGTMTPRRLKIINDRGWYITKITCCAVKKWRGRYHFIQFTKKNNGFHTFV